MLQAIETELVTLSIDRSETKVNNLLRAAHSIKGGAASLGLDAIADLAHQIEDIFRVLNHPELPFDRDLDRLLLQIYDCLNQLVCAEIHGESLAAGFHTRTQIVLADLDEEIGHFVIAGRDLPADILYGVDLTQSIFEVDVAQSLARLKRVLLDPACDPIVVGEFRAQSEVFTGIAALTNLPNFGNLAQATIEALDRHPDRAREMCCFALVDYYHALDAVLTGERQTCGEMSPGFAFALAEPPTTERANQPARTIYWQSEIIADSLLLADPEEIVADDFAQLEDLFEPEPPDEVAQEFESLAAPKILSETSANTFELTPQWLAAELESSQIFGDEPAPLDDRRWLSDVALAPDRTDEAALDFLIEDLMLAPGFSNIDPLDFDLVDLFEVERGRQRRSSGAAALIPTISSVDPLDFDLVEIFDAVGDGSWGSPLILANNLDDLNCDLVDIFDLPTTLVPAPPSNLQWLNIQGIISDLSANFDRLAPAAPDTFAPTTTPQKLRRVKKSRKIAKSPMSQLSVRVALDRLERMNNLMGELAIERHGLAIANEQVRDTLGRLRSKCEDFQTIGDRLRQIADNLVISTQHPAAASLPPEFGLDKDLHDRFDSLELDRYSEVHNIAQTTIEQLLQIEEQIEDLSMFADRSNRQIDRQKQLLSHLRDDLMWSRMLPLGEILNRFPRTIHDLSIEFNKPVELKITGAGILVDRAAMDKLLDPLVHLLRNAFDHGIDPPAIRQAAGKSERGTIEINAYHQGSQTIIEITDDGRGIDLNAIKAKAISLELLPPTAAAAVTPERLLDFLFEPGFTTTDRVTKLSGRGMGLDIVKEQIQSIKGTISIDSQVGKGTTFTLRIPLTLTIAQLMVCQVGNAVYAFPADSIYKIAIPTPAQLSQTDNGRVFQWRNLQIPVYELDLFLNYSIPVPERTISQTLKSSAENPPDWLPPLLMIRTGDRMIALEIDRLITEQELTIKPFGKSIRPPSYSYGCTILGDGVILPVLDPHTLIKVLIDRERPLCLPILPLAPVEIETISILVVDDSVTTRQSLCLSLEKYGYRTLQAKDGQEALQIVRQNPQDLKLVICDVEMPNMNGFEFLNVRRQDPKLTHIPVVMLTSRSNTKHRQFAAHLGALDYFIKPYIEQDFMTAIGKIVDG